MSTRPKHLISIDNYKKAKDFFTALISRIPLSELASEPPSELLARDQGTTDPLVYPGQRLSGVSRLTRPNLGCGRSESARASSERAELQLEKYRTK